MANVLYTTFQRMNRIFDGAWNVSSGIANIEPPKLDNEVIYRTEDPEKFQQKKLELQQNKYLQNRWRRVNQNLSMSTFAGLSNVKLMYRDADLMDSYPEIGAALDILCEEMTVTSGSKNGMIVNVSSKSDRIKSILEDLFVNRLNLQITGPMVARSMCKYGNQFMLLDIDKNLGIRGWRQLPVAEVERVENGITNPYSGTMSISVNNSGKNGEEDMSTQFIWTNEQGGQMMPFRNWQIAHFRLLNNSMFLPYGVSALMAARRHFRMLALMEDMMLIYRLERSMERRVYKIYVGSLDDDDIGPYIDQIADQFKRTPIVDPLTGQLDLRKNILPVHKSTPIPLTDGRVITIEELAKEYEDGKKNKVYSIQKNTGNVVEGNVVWCGKTGHPEELYKVTFYNGTHMILAAEHEVMMIDGKMRRADKIKIDEEVMPFSMVRKDNKHYKLIPTEYCIVAQIQRIPGDDVYCMTVEGDTPQTKDDRHNFALLTRCENNEINETVGCFVSNCASEDLFIPVRSENAPTPVDTLAGAKNLDAIDDIKYIQKKVCAALRIPQSFLNFEEAQGDGKNLALMDVRFTRTINRYQQAFLMELTKVATIHLYLLGFEDDLTNFTLTMNNPSTQAEQLEVETYQKKIGCLRDAVSDPGCGIPALSMQRALREILKWSDKEIKENLEEIRLEKALAAELEKTSQIIKRSGVFDGIDRIYGEPGAEYQEEQGGPGGGPDDMGGPGGGGFGGGLDDMGAPGMDEGMIDMGEEGVEPTENMSMPDDGNTQNELPEQPMESKKNNKPLLTESHMKRAMVYQNNKTNALFKLIVENMEKRDNDNEVNERVDVYDKSLMISEEFNNMLNKLNTFKAESLED